MEVCPPKVVKCDECETARKDLKVIHHCPSCEQYLCENCDKKMHGKGKRQAHERKAMATHTHFAPGTPPVAAHGGIPDSVTKCDECEGARDTVKVRCDACEQWLCEKCNTKLHKAGKRMAHVRKYFGGGSAPPVQGDKEVAPSSVKACSECETPRAELDVICQCEPCEQWLCEPCDDKLHKKGKRMAHVRKHFNTKDTAAPTNAPDLAPAAAVKCDECEAKRDDLDNIIRCDACEQWLCPNCDEKMHKKGKRIAHERHAYVTKAGAKPLAPKPKADPPAAKSPARQSAQSNATLTRAVSKAKEREEDKHEDDSKVKAKKDADDKEKAKKEEEKAKKEAEEKAAEDKKRKEEERQKAAAEKERKEKERAEADKAKQERDRKLKESEEKRAREKAALEEKKKKDEEELRLKIEQETREQLEKEEAAKELARKEKAERKKARDDKRRVKAEKQAQKEAEEKAAAEKAEAERLLREKAEGELRAKLEAEARAKIEAEMRAKVEAEMRAKQEEEDRQREKKERAEKKAAKEKADKERKEKEEKERQERIQKEKEELERKAEEERKRIEKEEQEAREQHEREEREAKEREEAEEKEREREAAEAAEAAAAEKARAAAASPKRRPPTIAKGAEKKAAPAAKTVVRSSSGDDELGIGDFDGGPEDDPPAPSSPSPSTSASTPAATPDLGPEEDVNFLKKGLLATKHDTSFGKKTQKRDMWYEAGVNGGNLQWGRPGEKRVADKKKQLAVVAISEVFVGKSSPSFKKIKEGTDPCCFSLVSKERQLDLECANEGDRDSFVRAIQHICKEHMITIQMHGAPKPRTSSTSSNGKGSKKQSVSAAARSMSPSSASAGARAVSPSNAKKPATVISAKNSVIADEPPPARAPPKKKAGDKRTCDDCLDPSAVLAVQCEECEQVLCADCDARIHKKGTRAAHARSPYVEGSAAASAAADTAAASATKHICQDCQDSANDVVCHCAECEQFLCHDCDQRIHKKGTRSKHVRDYLNESAGSASASGDHSGNNSATTSREGALSPAKGAGKSESESKEALGNQAFNNKKYDKAVGYFSELINQNPSGYKYFLKRANCYFFIDKFKDALADANQALDLAPQVMEGYVMKGKSLEKLGKAEEAIAAVQDGLRIEPGNVELKKALAKLKDEASQPPPAEPAPAATVKGKGHVRQPSKPPPPPNKAPPSSAVSVFNPRGTVADWDGEKEDDSQKKDKAEAGNVKAGIKAKLEQGGKKGPPPLPSGKAAAGKKEPPPLKKIDKSKTEALERTLSPGKAEKEKPAKKVEKVEKAEEEAPPPAPEDAAPPAGEGGDEWQELVDPGTGNKYWHNPTTQETTWDDPHAPKEDEWGEAKDPGTGKTYWYNTKTGATTWENPHASEWAESADPTTGKTFWYHIVTGQTTWDNPADAGKKKEPVTAAGPAIPTGMAVPKVVTVKNPEWSEHKDPSTGNVYYVNNKTQATTWSNPHQWNEWVDKSTGKKYWNNEVSGVTTWEYPK